MSEKVINDDEMTGFIMRKLEQHPLTYWDIRAVLDAEMEFLREKGIAEAEITETDTVDGRAIEYFHER